MCSVMVILEEDIFDEWVPVADCGWRGIPQDDTQEGRRLADSDADNHESYCEK